MPNKWQSAGGGNGRGIAFSASRDFIALSLWLIVPIMRSEMRESPLEWFMHFQIIIINPESAVSNGSANYNNKPRERTTTKTSRSRTRTRRRTGKENKYNKGNSRKCKCHLVLHERRSFKFIVPWLHFTPCTFNQPAQKIFGLARDRERQGEGEQRKVCAATAY